MRFKSTSFNHLASAFWALAVFVGVLGLGTTAYASEAELHIPELNTMYNLFGASVSGTSILFWGMIVAIAGMGFGLMEFMRIKKLPAHQSMLDVSHLIYETCKTYLFQQGKLLLLFGNLHRSMYLLLFLETPEHGTSESSPDSSLVSARDFGIFRSGLVRDSNQHLRK